MFPATLDLTECGEREQYQVQTQRQGQIVFYLDYLSGDPFAHVHLGETFLSPSFL